MLACLLQKGREKEVSGEGTWTVARMSPASTTAFPEVSLVKAPGQGDFVLGPSLACFILVTLLCCVLFLSVQSSGLWNCTIKKHG